MILPPQMQWAKTKLISNINIEICIFVEQKGWKKWAIYMWMCESHYEMVYII